MLKLKGKNCNKPHIYKITNDVNGKFYYGVHNGKQTKNYKSGSYLLHKSAYLKYGEENFTKEILMWFDTEEEAYEYEAVIVNQAMVDNPMCYNLRLGGIAIKMQEETKRKISNTLKGIPKSEEHNEKNRQAHLGKTFSDEHKRKLSESKKGKKKPKTSETNRRMNAKIVVCPFGCGFTSNPGNVGKHKKKCELKND